MMTNQIPKTHIYYVLTFKIDFGKLAAAAGAGATDAVLDSFTASVYDQQAFD